MGSAAPSRPDRRPRVEGRVSQMPGFLLLLALVLAGCLGGQTVRFTEARGSREFTAQLFLPQGRQGPFPVVVLVHGTTGVDDRYDFHQPALLQAGIGTFEVDIKTGIFTGPRDRPRPTTFEPFVFGALKALRAIPAVDPRRIAIMGFSLGGHQSVRAASRSVAARWLDPGEPGFAAHVGFYPSCRFLESFFAQEAPAGARILILAGEVDSYGDGSSCPRLVDLLNRRQPGIASLHLYPQVHHAFDRAGGASFYDPAAINQRGYNQWDGAAARDSRRRAVEFLRKALGIEDQPEGAPQSRRGQGGETA